MTKKSNYSDEPSPLEAILYELQAEVRSLKAEVKQLTENHVAVQEEMKKLTAANQNQNAANKTEENSQDNCDESKDATVAKESHIAATPVSNGIANRSDSDDEERASTSSPIANNGDDADEEEDLKSHLFTGSTHKYLFMDTIERSDDNTSYRVGLHHKVIASAVIGFQFYCYLVFGFLIYRDYQKGLDDRMTPSLHAVSPEVCYDTEAFPNDDPKWGHSDASWASPKGTYSDLGQAINTSEALLLGWIKCNHPTDNFDSTDNALILPIILSAAVLLGAFLVPDVYESFILITKCKGWRETMVGAIIVLKAAAGACVGTSAASNLHLKGLSDTFLLIVGLLFIHEVDEKLGYLQEIIEQTREKQKYFRVTLQFGCFFWFVYFFLFWCLSVLYDSFLSAWDLAGFLWAIVLGIIVSLVFAGIYFSFAFVTICLAKRRFEREDAAAAAAAATPTTAMTA